MVQPLITLLRGQTNGIIDYGCFAIIRQDHPEGLGFARFAAERAFVRSSRPSKGWQPTRGTSIFDFSL